MTGENSGSSTAHGKRRKKQGSSSKSVDRQEDRQRVHPAEATFRPGSSSKRKHPDRSAQHNAQQGPPNTRSPTKMVATPMSLRFLGTSSMPNYQRNYSSLLLKLGTDLVMVDCGEGTQQRFMRFGPGKLNNIRNILITHLHMDHVTGLVPLLCSMPVASDQKSTEPQINIYGPLGLRAFIRTQLHLCYSNLDIKYAVHELIWPSQRRSDAEELVKGPPDGNGGSAATTPAPALWQEPDTPLPGAILGPQRTLPILPRRDYELPGSDIVMDEKTCTWPGFATLFGGVTVSAAPILHRCPTLAYVISEPAAASPLAPDTFQRLDANAQGLRQRDGIINPRSLVGKLLRQRESVHLPDGTTMDPPPLDIPGRKVTICGDTYDASGGLQSTTQGVISLAHNSTVLVHECTNASLSPHLTREKANTLNVEDTRIRAASRGHSTPQVAGEFAGKIHAQAVLLNHFSTRYHSAPAEMMQRAFPNSNSPERCAVDIGAEMQRAAGHGFTSDRGPEGKLAVLKDISDQTTKSWHESMQDAGDSTLLPQDETLPTRKSVMDSHLWKRRRVVPTWDGFEYHILRDDELLSVGKTRSSVKWT